MAPSNWLVGLMLLSVCAIKALWGADLVVVAHLLSRESRWDILRDGTLWLGWYFITSGLFVFGVLGWFLLLEPSETVPLWFAIPCVIFTAECILAWHFLGTAEERVNGGPE